MKNNIALIGFMGVGKSAVARSLSAKTGKNLLVTDNEIEKKAGKQIPQIFEQEGEIAFREQEIDIIKQISGESDRVIDCGGGVVLNWINIQRLKQNAVIILLTADPVTIARRTGSGEGRPLLQTQNIAERIKDLYQSRLPFYERAADITIDTSEIAVEAVAEKILSEIKKHVDFN